MKKNRECHLWPSGIRKTVLIMRLLALFVFCTVMQVSATVHSQNVVFNFNLKNATFEDLMHEIRQNSDYYFIYKDSEVSKITGLNKQFKSVDIKVILDECLKGSGLTYSIENELILIKAIPVSAQDSTKKKERQVKGVVRDEKGEVLPGVTVRIKGTNLGTATDGKGEFVLSLPDKQEMVLVFSFIGMKPEELKLLGQKHLDVVLYEEKTEIEEVVVTGYQVVDKRSLTSSISSIKAGDLEKMGALTVDQMLEGKLPGLMITNLSAQPGAASKIRVRATGTFTGSREPLWVIDGVIYEDPVPLSASSINSLDDVNLIGNAITGLNPQDIESINVLKDASATAIYGTRAANGVIVVTTKRGKMGAAVVSYTGSFNVVDRPHYADFNLMDSKERVDVSREIYERGLGYPVIWPDHNSLQTPLAYEKALLAYWKNGNFGQFENEVSRLEMLNYDWFKELYQPAFNHSHFVSISGGADNVRYYFSVGYDNQQGTEKGVGLNRLTARTNIDVNLRKNVSIAFGMDGSVQKAEYNHTSVKAFNEAYTTSRAVEAKDEAGNLMYVNRLLVGRGNAFLENQYGGYNVLNERDNSLRKIDNKALNFNATLNWEVMKGVKLSSRFAYRNTTNLTEEWIKENTFYVAKLRSYDKIQENLDEALLKVHSMAPFGGIYFGGQTTSEAMSVRNQLNLVRTWNENHVFNLNLTQEASSTKYQGATGWQTPGYNHDQGRKFIALPDLIGSNFKSGVDDYLYQSMIKWFTGQNEGNVIYPTITEKTMNMISWMGIFTYVYADRYIINFNLRSDGSNAFGQYERYKFRPSWSTSVRWNLHNESFLMDKTKIDELAIRASYGFRGTSPNASPYLLLENYGHNNAAYFPENTADLSEFPNANLCWEKTATLNVGLNYSFFGNRISGVFDYAYSKSTDLLLTRPVSLVNGTADQLYNGGSKEDHTIEFDIRGQIIKTKEFRWDVSFNFTKIKENILKGTNVVAGQIAIDNYLDGSIMMEGFPVDGFYSYKFGGLTEAGLPDFPAFNEKYNSDYERLQDLLVYEGNRQPKFYGGFGTDVSYKGFTLSANFSYKIGQKIRLLEMYPDGQAMPLSGTNMRKEFVNRWRNPGDEEMTNIPVLTNNALTMGAVSSVFKPKNVNSLWNIYDLSETRTVKGDFIRWQSATLSYRCPDEFLKSIGLGSIVVRLQVQNPFVWALDKDLKGQDPEQVRNLGVPTLPSYTLGLTIGI